MTDTTPQSDAPVESPEDRPHSRTDPEPSNRSRLRPGNVRRFLAWGALVVCSLLAVYALFRFYGSVTATIDLWVEPRYQPLIHAAFNLVVLLGSLVGISLLVRELSS
ncbi:hypothetical protein [Natrialba sp. INN-245]|uniref:hypothetical protein n=1 Tax=Natrialba sp. INN-245 TaxID=2690967 RepID=UPI0013101198|nr:hypothetical protein [Natrialba sp. INN-245]MWV40446.1 hypothetical protein [Natrialba sp. INN-245]